jgi:hypothetical protein
MRSRNVSMLKSSFARKRRRMLWKLYFGLISFLVVGSVPLTLIDEPHPIYPVADYVILGLTAAQLIGLYGYAFKRPMLSERFWQLAFPVFTLNLIATLLIAGIRFAEARGDLGLLAATIVTSLFGPPLYFPLLLADRRYAFRSTTTIWKIAGDHKPARPSEADFCAFMSRHSIAARPPGRPNAGSGAAQRRARA